LDLQLTNKIALVSGSTAGIGNAIAASLAREGARVIVNGRTSAAVDGAVAAMKSATRGDVVGFAGDLSAAAVAEKLLQAHPHVDILVNNLGIFEVRAFEDITDADWQRFFDVNVLSGARLSRLYLPSMRQRNWGRIIFISSESGFQIPAEMVHYGMSKTAQVAVARGLAESVAGTGVTVNSVLPGPTASEGAVGFLDSLAKKSGLSPAEMEKEFFKSARPSSLLKRFETPEEIAAVVTFVASAQSVAISGASVRAEGGVIRSI
jgi:NAD(P)-dependent dehydrogenase (short-subunit alcohol dehydrogenase family)